MARRQRRDLFAAAQQERIRANKQRAHLLLDDSREGRVDVALGARTQGMDL